MATHAVDTDSTLRCTACEDDSVGLTLHACLGVSRQVADACSALLLAKRVFQDIVELVGDGRVGRRQCEVAIVHRNLRLLTQVVVVLVGLAQPDDEARVALNARIGAGARAGTRLGIVARLVG